MKRYDLSKIMSRAWYIYRRSFNMTFAEALKESWRRFKHEVQMQEEAAKRAAEYKAKFSNRDKENYYNYRGSRMGRNDWARDYQNHARAAIKRSMNLNDMAR